MADEKPKRAPSAWAVAVQKHIKAGGKFPKKGTADYDAVKKLMGDKAPAEPKAEPKPKAERKKRKPKVAEAAKDDIIVGKEVNVEHVIAEKPKRKPRAPKVVKADSPVAEQPKEVTGRNVSVSHVIPLMRMSSGSGPMKIPFS